MGRAKASARKSVSSHPNWELNLVENPIREVGTVDNREVDNLENREEELNDSEDDEDGSIGDNDGVGEEDDDVVQDDGGEDDVVQVEENAGEALSSHFGDVNGDNQDEDSDASVDEVWRDDVIPNPVSDDEDSEKENADSEEDNPGESDAELKLGKCFCSAAEFKQALLRYSLKTRYDIKLYLANVKKLGAVCSDTEYICPWRVYASYEKRKRKLQIKVYESQHTCIRSGYSKMLKVSTIAQMFAEKLRKDPKFPVVEMKSEIKRMYNLIVTEEQCRKAKYTVNRARRKRHEEQFARIWDYEAELHKTNRGTHIDIETVPGATPGSLQRFYRIYICFEAQRAAWTKYCRPIIGLDGAFLKWDIKGQLIAAVGRDGDNRIVPIAWAVVEIENDVNWDWFVTHLKNDLGLGQGLNFTVVSDKQKGLVKAVETQLPEAEHRMCARHILGNWRRDNHDMEIERLFWRIARSYTMGEYADNLQALRYLSPSCYDSLLRTNPETWSRAFFKIGSCCNDVLNNLSESFNKTIREARRKPLLDLLEDVRRQCMVRTAKRSLIAERVKTRFTRSVHKQIEESIKRSRECVRYMSTGDMHEVDVHGCSYRVSMREQTCGCGKWQLNGIPCEHAASVIVGCKLKVDDFVSEYFTAENWKKTYRVGIQPVQGMKLWPRVNRLPVLPPPNRVGKGGRPSNYARRKSQGETSSSSKGSKTRLSRAKRIMSCSNCKQEGHNKASCTNPFKEPPAKRQRGRPRKTTVSIFVMCIIHLQQLLIFVS